MNHIWEKLVPQNEATAINSLMQDETSNLLILKSLGQNFLSNDEIFLIDSLGQFILMIANAPFIQSDEECIQITHIIQWGIKKIDVFPKITEHKNQELAYRCLLSLGLFKSNMEKKTKYHGAPSPNFYRKIGINTFKEIGFIEISQDFNKWECYLGEITR